MRDRLANLAVWSSHLQLVCNSHGMYRADFHFEIGLFISMLMADVVGNWFVQSVADEDIDYICVQVVGPKDKLKVLAGQASQCLFKAPDAKHAQAAANKTVDSDDEYFNMIRESLLTPQQERAPSAAKGRKAHSLLRMSLNVGLR